MSKTIEAKSVLLAGMICVASLSSPMKPSSQLKSLRLSRFCMVLFMVIAACLLAPGALHAQTLADAVDAPQLTWTTGGSLPWVGQTNVTFDDVDAAQSGLITHSQESWMQTTLTGPGELTFRWKVSSESGYDYLEFYLNGVLQSGPISGNMDWQQQTFNLSGGSQTLRWRYFKDGSASSGQDRAWVDMVSFGPASGPPMIVTQPQSQSAFAGANVAFDVVASGAPPLFYQWFKDTTPLDGANNSTYGILNVQTNDAASYSIVVTNTFGSVTSTPAILTLTLNAPVTLDGAFNPGLGGNSLRTINALAVQPDGRILVVGVFTTLGGQSQTNIGRLNADGTLDTTFNTVTDWYSDVNCLALQPDGKILVGGNFNNLGGQPRSRIGRLNADGTLDSTFNPGAGGSVYCIALQPDGKILVGGEFSNLGGQSRTNLGRLNADGSLDTSFSPGVTAFNSAQVYCLTLQPDGKILVGGNFSALGGQSRLNIGRLNTNGTPDTVFNPGANGNVFSMALQPDGNILLAGSFDTLGGQSRQGLGRINTNGTLDTTFNPEAYGVSSLALQSDGKIVIGGGFFTVNGEARAGLGRLNADGTLDLTFNPDHDGYDVCLTLQPDGKILVGGNFTTLLGQPRSRIGRLLNTDPATQSLDLVSSTITWLRGGTTPEVWRSTFDYSVDGLWWTNFGTGTRVAGGWQVTGVSLPADATLRARGLVAGDDKGSAWLVEQYQGRPVLVTQPASRTNDAGTTAIFFAPAGGSQPLKYFWRKNGIALANGDNIAGASSPTLTLSQVSKAEEGGYTLVASNSFGSLTSVVATLVVLDPYLTQQPVGADLNSGTNVTFQVAANGTPPLSCAWYRNGAAVIEATNSALTLSNLSVADAGFYTAVVTGPQGSITSAPALLSVRPPLFLNPTPGDSDGFGEAVAALGSDRLIVAAPDDDTGTNDSGTVYLFSTNRVLLTTITNPSPALEDHFGYSVAAVGSDRILIGAWGDNTGSNNAGAAYLFNTNGTLLTTFTNPTPQADESFGISVTAVGADTVLIGAYFENNTSGFASGAAYLFNTNGTLLTTFINPTPAVGDGFGWSVAALGDNLVLIGAIMDDVGASDSGAAHLFRNDGTWLATFPNPTPASGDAFGYALTGVGSDRVLISARTDTAGGPNAGAAYLFSTNGTLLTTFTNPTPSSPFAFGQAVASVGEDHVVISAHVSVTAPLAGKVYLFSTDGTLLTDIADPDPTSGGNFGYALAAMGSNKAIVGAPDTAAGGEAYLIDLPLGSATGPATIVTQPQSQTVIQDTSVALKVVAGGAPPLWYQWFKNTTALTGATTNTYTLANVQTNDAGVYSVVVSNTLGSVISSNAVLTVLPLLVSTQTLVFNETAYGRIESSNRVDHWVFSALAGQQVTFDLISVSAAGLRFDLRGPSGWTGFTNLVTDSGLVNLPANGTYSLVARGAAGATDIAYAFKLIETTQTLLPLGTNFIGQFTGSGQALLFKITVTNSGPLRISLLNTGTGNRTELYASRIVPPTRGTFEQQSATGSGSSRELFIPNASVGDLYVLVYGDSIPTPGQFTIRASSPGVVLSAITPNRQATNSSFAMTLTGAGFDPGDTVQLLAGGGGVVATATNVSLDTYSQLTADFPPSTAAAGLYSVRVTQLDGDTATLTNVFNLFNITSSPGGVASAGPGPKLETRLILPGELGRDAPATLYVEYANTGSASMPAPVLILKSSDPDGSDRPILTMDQSRQVQSFWSAGLPPGTAHEIFILASGAQPGVLNPGERRRVSVYYLGLLEDWDTSDTKVEMQIRYWTADDTSPIDWAARKASLRPPTLDSLTWNVVYDNLTSGLTNTGAYVRMLGDNASYLGRLGQVVTDVDQLWNFELQQAWGYSPLSVLDSVTDASMLSPGVSLEISRRFSANLRARNSTGLFGRGWYTPWQSRLLVETNADLVRLVGEAGSASVFSRDTRAANRYFSGVGDSSALTSLGSNIFELREPSGTVTRFRADGRTDYVQDVNGNRVTAGYDGFGRITSLTHSSGGSITIGYNINSLISSVADSAGRTNIYTYSGLYLQTVTTSDGKVTSYTYETGGNNAQRHALKSITRGGTTRSYTFDTRGRIASAFVASGEQLVNFTYDSAGGVYTTDARGTTSLFFDHNGQLAKTRDPLGNITTSEFDSELRLKRLVTPTGESQSFTWCNCGSPTSITDELGHTTKFAYDNPFPRLTSFTDAKGNTTSYTYNTNGNLLATIYPNNSAETFGGYNPAGLPLSYTNRRSQPITYTYTPVGQISRQSFTNGSYNEFFYDLRGNLTNVTEHLAGSTNKVITYLYDYATAGDRLRKVTYPNARWVEFFYDGFGRRERMTDVTGQDLRYDYDAAGRLWRLRDATNSVIVEYLYNGAGRLQRINKGNGTYTTYDYDAAGQILHLVNHAPNSSVNSRFDYTYDKRGRRTSMGTLDGDWTYNHDATGQLIRARLVSTNPQIPNQDLQYNYDALGNRTTTVSNGVTAIYAANNLNQYAIVGGVAYQYDADGSLIFDGVRTYEYNAQNRLVRVTGPEGVTEYEYDALGNRTATVLNGQRTEYLLDPSGLVDVIAEYDGAGSILSRQVHGLGLVGQYSETIGLNLLEFDALGSTVAIAETLGILTNRYAYQPFGERLVLNETMDNDFEFTGRFGVLANATGLDYMRNRYYSSPIGRFVSVDPIGLLSGDRNLYRYTQNSPVDLVDPLGLYDTWSDRYPSIPLYGSESDVRIKRLRQGGYNFLYETSYYSDKTGKIQRLSIQLYVPDAGTQGDEAETEVAESTDPNEKLGAKGVGTQNWVTANAIIPYRINFENLSSATAPAQEVVITDQLSTNLNWETFQLTELGFGDVMIPVPPGLQYYETTVQMTCCGDPFEAQIEAGLNTASGELRVVFRSINPASSLPPPVSVGFLPPEDGTGRGKGHVSYLINAKTNLPTGRQIRNVALITFDRQQSIATDQIDPQNPGAGIDPNKQALNTIDAGAPSSSVTALPAESGRAITVKWSGQDDVGGSGIADYNVYVSTNGGAFGEWLTQTTNTTALFRGETQKAYGFFTVARDQVGNVESAPLTPDASTLVVSNAPTLAELTNAVAQPGSGFSTTNVILSGSTQGNFVFSLGSAPSGFSVNETNGVLNWTPNCPQGNTTNLITVWVTDSARTNISDAISFLVAVEKCVEPSLGQVIVLAGESGQIPLNLISTAVLTNLQATLVATPGRLLNFSIQPLVSNVAATSVVVLSNDWKRLSLTMSSNGFLSGTQQVAWLNFTAADLASAFVPLSLTNLVGYESNGVPVANFAPQTGRVVVISDEPLLEMVRNTNGLPLLYLYGKLAPGYSIETRTNLTQANWQTIVSTLVMTNLVREITPPASVSPGNFFRALRVGSITPARLRSAELVRQTNVVFQVRGLANRSYNIQMSPGLGTPDWQTIGSVTCDRDGVAQFTNGVPASATERYFRTTTPN